MQAFRTLVRSKFGGAIILLFLIVLGFSFVSTDLRSLGIHGRAPVGSIASVDGSAINVNELNQRIRREFENARQQDQSLDMARFIADGGVERALDRTIDGIVLENYAREQGIVVSRRLEDGQISSIPAFVGLDGKFDRATFQQFLQRSRMNEAQFRTDIARDAIANQLVLPIAGGAQAPATLALPYASMLLEGRAGKVAFVPSSAMRTGSAPSDAEIGRYYKANIARYTLPERRVARYALVSESAFNAAAQPSEAEVAKAYADGKSRYAARETRTLTQVIVPTEAAARTIVAKAAGGVSLAAAATAAGGEAVTLDPLSRDAFAELSSPAVAAAAFASARGTVTAPAKSGLGWHVVHVDAIETTPGRSLEQVRDEITAKLRTEKAEQAAADYVAKLEDEIAEGATFDEVIGARKLQAATTAPLLVTGRDPSAPDAKLAPETAPVAKASFGMEPDDDPVVEQVVPNLLYAIVDLDRIVPSAPRPLATIRDQVARDLVADRALAEARKVAATILAQVNGGTPLAQAVARAGVPLPAPTAIGGLRRTVLQNRQAVAPADALLFTMVERRAKLLAAPDKSGWSVVYLERIDRGDASRTPELVEATRRQFSGLLSEEYAQQFVGALRARAGVTRDQAAIARLKADLLGTPSSDQ